MAVSEQNRSPFEQILLTDDRPPSPGKLSVSLTFARRALLKIRYQPEQLLDVTFFPVLMTLMFTYLFGGALAGSTGKYLQFLIPGILVQTVIFTTVFTGVALNTDISKGVNDRIRSMPVWSPAPLVGGLLADAVRYTMASVIVLIIGLILGYRPTANFPAIIAAIVLVLIFAFSLSWAFTTIGLIMKTSAAVMGISMTLLLPFTFVSNILVSPATMPSWLRAFVNVNPVSLLTSAVRELLSGTFSAASISWVLLASAIFIIIFAPLTMRLYRNK
ncbi:MAG: ABC transporter permease [Sporolactobacillus sp.]